MPYMAHHALVVTTSDIDDAERARERAVQIFVEFDMTHTARNPVGLVSPVAPGAVNYGGSFVVFPDGSGERYEVSGEGDRCRAELIEWLDAQLDPNDGSTSYKYVLVRFGEDEGRPPRVEASDTAATAAWRDGAAAGGLATRMSGVVNESSPGSLAAAVARLRPNEFQRLAAAVAAAGPDDAGTVAV